MQLLHFTYLTLLYNIWFNHKSCNQIFRPWSKKFTDFFFSAWKTKFDMKLQQRQNHDEIPRDDQEISHGEISPGHHEISLRLLVRYLMVTMRFLLVKINWPYPTTRGDCDCVQSHFYVKPNFRWFVGYLIWFGCVVVELWLSCGFDNIFHF